MPEIKWKCYARPAWRGGKTCGHENTKGIMGANGVLCCEECGCTKVASDFRREREERDEKGNRHKKESQS